MYISELNSPTLLVIYPGRFQPFHKGHHAVYEFLTSKFGRNNVFIATSNKVDGDKSPFTFSEKAYFMQLAGVPADRIVQSANPYQIESILQTSNIQVNSANTVVIFAVSEKDMSENPRFKSWTKKDGSPAYFQPLEDINNTKNMTEHGYILTVPTFDFNVLGQPMRSGTELRRMYVEADEKTRQAIIKDLFGKYTVEAEQVMTNKLVPKTPTSVQMTPHPTEPQAALGEHIVKHGSQYRLLSKHGNKNLGTFPTKAAAEKHEREVQYFKHAGESVESKVPDWMALGEELSMKDKISIFETYHSDGALLESDTHNTDYFTGLQRYSGILTKNKKYIVTPLMLIQNRVISLNTELLKLTFVGKHGSQFVFSKDDGTNVEFPNNQVGQQGLIHTFTFDNISSYNKFRSELSLKFNVNLPDPAVAEEVDTGLGTSTDAEMQRTVGFAKAHYPGSKSPSDAFHKFVQRSLSHSKEDDTKQNIALKQLANEILALKKQFASIKGQQPVSEEFDDAAFSRHMDRLRAQKELEKTDPLRALVGQLHRDDAHFAKMKQRTPATDDTDINSPFHPSQGVNVGEAQGGTSVKAWAAQVRNEHGSDVKFTNKVTAGGIDNRAIARNSQGETVGVYNRNTGDATVFEPKQAMAEGEAEALQYATQAHAGQTRAGGDPYITHPMRVADHIRQYKQSHNLDALISAAYLHDTVEDTDTTQEALHDLFGGLVASLVQELTSDPAQIKKQGKAAYLSHKMAAMSSYALVIKLADRLDNVKDITTAKTPQWRAKYAAETNQILNYIEKTRALSGTHQKLISLIRTKLSEINELAPGEQG